MKLSNLFKEECLTFLEYVQRDRTLPHLLHDKLFKVLSIYSQPFSLEDVIRPEEPDVQNYFGTGNPQVPRGDYHGDFEAYQNWQPTFQDGEWKWSESPNSLWFGLLPEKSIRVDKRKIITREDFIRECKNAGIKLKWNLEKEI